MNSSQMTAAKKAVFPIVAKKTKKHDVGKKNNGTTTGFQAVADKAAKEYGSQEAGNKVAGAVYKKMKAVGKA